MQKKCQQLKNDLLSVKEKVTVPGVKYGKEVYSGREFTAGIDGSLIFKLKPLEIPVICLSK